MGATNSTLHYQLSQFISTDKPAWLQDYNGDMQKIDTGINGALTAAESAQNSADSASSGVSSLSDSVSALSTTVAGHTSDIADLSGDVNTIESLIGNGTPTAGDHTLIGAINTNTNDIADINTSLEWKNGWNNNANEHFIMISVVGGGRLCTIIPHAALGDSPSSFIFGSGSATAGVSVTCSIAKNSFVITAVYINGASGSASETLLYR